MTDQNKTNADKIYSLFRKHGLGLGMRDYNLKMYEKDIIETVIQNDIKRYGEDIFEKAKTYIMTIHRKAYINSIYGWGQKDLDFFLETLGKKLNNEITEQECDERIEAYFEDFVIEDYEDRILEDFDELVENNQFGYFELERLINCCGLREKLKDKIFRIKNKPLFDLFLSSMMDTDYEIFLIKCYNNKDLKEAPMWDYFSTYYKQNDLKTQLTIFIENDVLYEDIFLELLKKYYQEEKNNEYLFDLISRSTNFMILKNFIKISSEMDKLSSYEKFVKQNKASYKFFKDVLNNKFGYCEYKFKKGVMKDELCGRKGTNKNKHKEYRCYHHDK